jgi:hypothetical protein
MSSARWRTSAIARVPEKYGTRWTSVTRVGDGVEVVGVARGVGVEVVDLLAVGSSASVHPASRRTPTASATPYRFTTRG